MPSSDIRERVSKSLMIRLMRSTSSRLLSTCFAFAEVACPLPFCFPAALRSTGVFPFRRYYGGSDSRPAPLARGPVRVGLHASPMRPSLRSHLNHPPPSDPPLGRECPGGPVPVCAGGFAIRSQARHGGRPNQVHFRLGPQVRLGLLSTPPRGDAVASGCSPGSRPGRTLTFRG